VNYRVVFTARASADAVRQFHFLADRSPAAAARWYTGLDKAIDKLAKVPERHPIAEDESEQLGITVRQLLYGRRPGVFRILFSIEGDTVTLPCSMYDTVPKGRLRLIERLAAYSDAQVAPSDNMAEIHSNGQTRRSSCFLTPLSGLPR
jgi:plasmid stabilization system protein ParE